LSDCPVPVKTDVGQVDLVLRLSDRTSEKIRDSQTCRYDGQIYSHWYKILGLLYKRALFDLKFVHNLFWLKLEWNAKSKLFYCIIYRSSTGRIQDFKLGGVHLKIIAPSGGRHEIFGVFRVKNHDFTPKNHIFFQFWGGGSTRWVHPPESAPAPCCDEVQGHW
jgi:hypothetical protein